MNLDHVLTVTLVLAVGAFLGAPVVLPRLKEAYIRHRVRTYKSREQKAAQAALQRRQQQQILENYDRTVPEVSPSASDRPPEATDMASSRGLMEQRVVQQETGLQGAETPQEALMSFQQGYQHFYNAGTEADLPGQPLQKNALLALLLAFFIGSLGVHNFYLSKKGIAITQLVLTITGWGFPVSFLWSMVECLLILTGTLKDGNGDNLTWSWSSSGGEGGKLYGVILLIALTVVLAGVLYVWASALAADLDSVSVTDFSVSSSYADETQEYCTATFSLSPGQHRYCKVDVSQTQAFAIQLSVDESWEDVRLYTMRDVDYASFSDDAPFNYISELSAVDVNSADLSGILDAGQIYYVVVYHPYDWEN